jgi:hypothetical protein
MDAWDWPTVPAGRAERVYVEFGTKGHWRDDAGEAYYSIADTSNKFTVLARRPDDWMLTIDLNELATKTSPKGSKVELGFRHDAAVNWILSQDESGAWWSNSGSMTDWMQQSMGSLANRTLRHIAMPGSHDAGMSEFNPGTVGANFMNTQTQYLDFYQQLMHGSRFFDLRPVISNGKWVAGHYSEAGDAVWLGGNGMAISDVVKQVNDFTKDHQELIIINLSHTLDTDNDYKDLTQDQWNDLFEELKGINNRFTQENSGKTDFSESVLGDFITDRASVFIVAQLPSGISLGKYANEGFFNQDNFPFYDSYSDSDDYATMSKDQLEKVKKERNIVSDDGKRKDKFHILSWTLTQKPDDVLNPDNAIMNFGAEVFDALISDAFNSFTPESFPNVLYVDALGVRDKPVVFPFDKPRTVATNTDIVALAIAINNSKAGQNSYITKR